MKTKLVSTFPILLWLSLTLIGCNDHCQTQRTYTFFEPIYESLNGIRSGIELLDGQTLRNPGKIYLYGSYLFINEPGEGIHVVYNENKRDPQFVKFIRIPGNFDMAIKDQVLYADSYIDLVGLDISNLENITEIFREENVFPNYNVQFGFAAEDGMVIRGWEEKETVEVSDFCRSTGGMVIMEFGVAMADAATASFSGPSPSPVGVGGSMARFAVLNDALYTVDFYDLSVFDVSIPRQPAFENKVSIGWDIETIFPFKQNLFVGASSGMHIYDVTDPYLPEYVSNFIHVTACDPVVANDQYAFVTLRSGTMCDGFTNQLEVINIERIDQPVLEKTYPMQNPHGLGLDGNVLFVSEGDFGLKIYDIDDIHQISENQIAYFPDIHSFDVIPWENVLISIGRDGLYQYDYSDVTQIQLLSYIPSSIEL